MLPTTTHELEALVARHGEEWRQMIRVACAWLDEKERQMQADGLTLRRTNRAGFILSLLRKAHRPEDATHTGRGE